MCKINEIIKYKGINLKRVSKKKIENIIISNELFNLPKNKKNIIVYAIPCNANIYSPWINLFKSEFTSIIDFSKWINAVSYYNCNNELGNYLHYYIEI